MSAHEAHVEVFRLHGEIAHPWAAQCADFECPGWEAFVDNHLTHAEALAAAIQHCETYPRKDQP